MPRDAVPAHPLCGAEHTPNPAVRDAERTRAAILAAATVEFSAHGLSGARVDRIAKHSKINKRMLYYYFGDKEALYLAVLEAAYESIRGEERKIRLSDLSPGDGMRELCVFT